MSDELEDASPGDTTLDEVRARLEARGLLANSPPILIPREPRPGAAPTEPVEQQEPAETHWADSERDAWDVEPGGARTEVGCPQCFDRITVPLEATRVHCPRCDRTWRFAVCEHCDGLTLTIERQESWRCGRCGEFSRSWWRTEGAHYLAERVLAKRRDAYVGEQRAAVREGVRRRRWKLVLFAVVAALLGAVVVIGTRVAESEPPSGATVVCPHFRQILEDLTTGRLSQPQLDEALAGLEGEAGDDSELVVPVRALRAAGAPAAPAFIAARSELVDTCGADFGRSR